MDLKRAIEGPILSVLFLVFFFYAIFGLQRIFENYANYPSGLNNKALTGSLSGGLQNVVPENTADNVVPPSTGEISMPEINAESAISVESNLWGVNKTIFEKNSDAQLPIASLTKLMTAVIVLDNYNLSDTITVDKIADSRGPMKEDVKLGDVLSVESFLDMMLVASSNKSAYALSEGPGGQLGEQKFVELMNQKAKDLELENTFFADPTGLSPKNVSTARDLVRLAEYILKNYPKIAETSKAKELYVSGFGKITNTNELLSEIPEIICGKTGFTAVAKGCLLLVVNNLKNNDYLIGVILGADDRFSEMEKLINWSAAICE